MTITRSLDGVSHRSSNQPRPSRRLVRVSAFAFVGLLALTACQANNTPPGFGDATKKSFMDTCTGDVPPDAGTTTTLASSNFCACSYAVFVAQVPFNDDEKQKAQFSTYNNFNGGAYSPTYVQFNLDLHDNPNKFESMPQPVQDAVATCKRENPTPAPGIPTGTTPGSTPGTAVGTSSGTTPGSTPGTASDGAPLKSAAGA